MKNKKEEKGYFDEGDIQENVNKMTGSEMNSLLLGLEGTDYWVAILKYLQLRISFTQTAVFTIDPVKEGGRVAQNQGILMGLSDLPNAIIELKKQRDKETEKQINKDSGENQDESENIP